MKGPNEKQSLHVTAGLIWKQGRVLIAKRPEGSQNEGFWEFPGGKQEKDESLEDCLEREIEEELGVRIKPVAELLTVEHDYGTKVVSLHVFHCTDLKGEPKSLQAQDLKWVAPSHFERYTFLPPDKKVVEFLTREKVLPHF